MDREDLVEEVSRKIQAVVMNCDGFEFLANWDRSLSEVKIPTISLQGIKSSGRFY